MALIKSNQLVQQGSSVVLGDKITQDAASVRPSRKKGEEKSEKAEKNERIEKPVEQKLMPSEEPGDLPENQDENNEKTEAPEKPAVPPEKLIGDFDEGRDLLLGQEGEALEALEAERQVAIAERMGDVLEERSTEVAAAITELHSDEDEAQEIITRLMPYAEHQASAEAEKILFEEYLAPKWQEIGTTEEKIGAFLESYVKKLSKDPGNSEKFLALLSEREAILAEARLKALDIVQQAEMVAAQLVAEAEAKATQTILDVENNRQDILNELEQQGYAQGYQEGRSQADLEGAEVVSEAIETLNKVRMAYPLAIKDNEENLLKLAIQIAERIIQEEIAMKPEICVKMLEAAIRKVSDLEHVVIKANEEDLPFLLEHEDRFREMLKNVKNLEFAASKKVARGGVLIETTAGSVDASISTQLSVLKEAFDQVRAEYGDDNSEDTAWEEVDQ
ncbi:MAG TPA: FliH/SctL family protein [Chroococcales cyanobacterium]|jgi:flagellar assembly protein FliH